MVIVVMLIIS